MPPLRILILGGSSEASALARTLAGDPRFAATLSLAGRTTAPALAPLPSRIGGFGGAPGLASYLTAHAIDALIDATHPFAARITANAIIAANETQTPYLRINRPEWQPTPADRWTRVPSMEHAAAALGPQPRRVFLTIGQLELAPFRTMPHHHYLIRSIEPPAPELCPPHASFITARFPCDEAAERALLQTHLIETLVTKNSGAAATAAKLAAARALGLPVIMVERPPEAAINTVATATAALHWLETLHAATIPRGV